MRKLALLPVFAALAFAYPAGAGAAVFHGTVVAKQTNRHVLVLASRTGAVHSIRTQRMGIRVGTRLAVKARALPDGTFRATRIAASGRAHHARVRAVVVRTLRLRMIVSAGHSAFAIRLAHRSSHAWASAGGGGNGPAPGTVVDAKVSISSSGELDEDDMDEVGQTDTVELNGTLAAMTPSTATAPGSLTVTVGTLSFTIVVPPGVDVSKLKVGDRIHVKATVDGTTLTLVKLGHDDEQGDDDDEDDDDDGGGGDDD